MADLSVEVPSRKLISEAIQPMIEVPSPLAPVVGSPILPGAFRWRKQTHQVSTVLSQGKKMGPCTHGSSEMYLRRHTWTLRMEDGAEWEILFERQPRANAKRRWWLRFVTTPVETPED